MPTDGLIEYIDNDIFQLVREVNEQDSWNLECEMLADDAEYVGIL